MPLALAAVLIVQLSGIGWGAIWQSRPSSPIFYGLVVIAFFVQPFGDLIIYRRLWQASERLRLSIFLRKRYLNAVMLDYSGEAYFFFWAKRYVDAPASTLLHTIKDSNILSATAGLATTILVVCALVVADGNRLLDYLAGHIPGAPLAAIAVVLPLGLALALALGGRRITTTNRRQVLWIFSVHLSRSLIALGLECAIWISSAALPSVTHCLYVVALRVLVGRLPLLPHKDMIFAGAALTAAQLLELQADSIAAVLVLSTVIDNLMGFALVNIPWLLHRWTRPDRLPLRTGALSSDRP